MDQVDRVGSGRPGHVLPAVAGARAADPAARQRGAAADSLGLPVAVPDQLLPGAQAVLPVRAGVPGGAGAAVLLWPAVLCGVAAVFPGLARLELAPLTFTAASTPLYIIPARLGPGPGLELYVFSSSGLPILRAETRDWT